jgi:hypothetical protein
MAHQPLNHVWGEGNSPSKETSQIICTETPLSIFIVNELENLMDNRRTVSRSLSFFSRETTYSHRK